MSENKFANNIIKEILIENNWESKYTFPTASKPNLDFIKKVKKILKTFLIYCLHYIYIYVICIYIYILILI